MNSLDHLSSMMVAVCHVHRRGKLNDAVVRWRLALVQGVEPARERADNLGAVVDLARLLGTVVAEHVHRHLLATRRTTSSRGGTEVVPALAEPPVVAAVLAVAAAAAAAAPHGQPVADPADKVHGEDEEGEEQEEGQEANDEEAKGNVAAAGEVVGPVVHDCEETLSDTGVMNGVGHAGRICQVSVLVY